MILKKITSVFLFFVFAISSIAQSEKINLQKDSSDTQLLSRYNEKLENIKTQHEIDSAKKIELENQLTSLKKTDNLKKEELEKQIQELKEKDVKRLAIRKAKIDSLRSTVNGYPVLGFFYDTLFFIYTKSGSFSASSRASIITERIESFGEKFLSIKDSIYLNDLETTIDIVSGETIIMSISDNDALWNNSTRQDLALTYKSIITNALKNYKSEISLLTLSKEVGLALLVVFTFCILIYYLKKYLNGLQLKFQVLKTIIYLGLKLKTTRY